MGTMNEAGGLLLMSLRLRVELGRITEIESVFFKPGGAGPNNRRVEMVGNSTPYHTNSPWPGNLSGN
jgi:hypothetical protein